MLLDSHAGGKHGAGGEQRLGTVGEQGAGTEGEQGVGSGDGTHLGDGHQDMGGEECSKYGFA